MQQNVNIRAKNGANNLPDNQDQCKKNKKSTMPGTELNVTGLYRQIWQQKYGIFPGWRFPHQFIHTILSHLPPITGLLNYYAFHHRKTLTFHPLPDLKYFLKVEVH